MLEDERSTRTGHEREDIPLKTQACNSEGSTNKYKEGSQGHTDKTREPNDIIESSHSSPKKCTKANEKYKDESFKKSPGTKPSKKLDVEKMKFHTDEGVFCYTKMPFGLKNVEATYQRLVDTVFEGQMGRNLETYVDDIVIKSKTELEMINDVEETLLTLKKTVKKILPRPYNQDTMTEDNLTQAKTDGSDDTIAKRESMEKQEDIETKAPKNLKTEIDMWKLYTDGASIEHGFGAGLILIDPEGVKYSYALRLNFTNSNNDAEYKALLVGLRIAKRIKVEKNTCIYGFNIGSILGEGVIRSKKGKDKEI
nr:reverse transcriptase domain-containing protein [Tanacetum cinerariifolium]